MSVTVLLPVFNEELHLARSLDSVVGWADRVVVIDSFSDDRTPQIAAAYAQRGVEFVQHRYEGPADQKNWALEHLGIDTVWVLFLDADECVSPDLAAEIAGLCSQPLGPQSPAGYFLNRRILWMGKWIRHGGWFPNWNLRLFQFGRARYEQRRVHEHMECDGPTTKLRGHLVHEDVRDLTHSIAKHNRYSSLEAAEYFELLRGRRDTYARLFTRDPLARRRWIKTKLWARLPAKPMLYFFWCYFLRAGFLDGLTGLRYHLLHAMFKAFDEAKLWEMRTAKKRARSTPQAGAASRPGGDMRTAA